MTAAQSDLYEDAFLKHGFTPRQFLELCQASDAKWYCIAEGDYITVQGKTNYISIYYISGSLTLAVALALPSVLVLALAVALALCSGPFYKPSFYCRRWPCDPTSILVAGVLIVYSIMDAEDECARARVCVCVCVCVDVRFFAQRFLISVLLLLLFFSFLFSPEKANR